MKTDELMSKIFGFSIPTYYNWKKENRLIISLIDKYFSKDELIEFLYKKEIANQEFFMKINMDFTLEYQRFIDSFLPVDGSFKQEYTFPEKIYWDFIYRFKKDIDSNNCFDKHDFMALLYEYQVILINISNTINYSQCKIVEEFNYFINLFSGKDDKFIKYLINLIRHNFIQVDYYQRDAFIQNEEEYEDEQVKDNATFNRLIPYLKGKIIPYENKNTIKIPIHVLKAINNQNSYSTRMFFFTEKEKLEYDNNREKDFFEVYEDYLKQQELLDI